MPSDTCARCGLPIEVEERADRLNEYRRSAHWATTTCLDRLRTALAAAQAEREDTVDLAKKHVAHEIGMRRRGVEQATAELKAKLAAAEAERDRLREALRPFAVEAGFLHADETAGCIMDDVQLWQVGGAVTARTRLTYGDLRRARAALSQEKPDD